jgi:hypothetical protein
MRKQGMNNPAAAFAGMEVAKQTASLIPFLVKLGIFAGIGYFAYTTFIRRFKKIGENPKFPAANITLGEAQTRAESMYAAMQGIGADFKTVQYNLSGINYNAWVRIYNAFGLRNGVNPLEDKTDLVEWLLSQFNESELAQLRFVTPGLFNPAYALPINFLGNFLMKYIIN